MSEATQSVSDDVAADMLGAAAKMGMQVSDSAQEALSEAPEAVEAPSEPDPVPLPTVAEEVAEDLGQEAEEKFVLPEFKPIPEDEFAAFEEEEAEQGIAELKDLLDEGEDGYSDIEDADELRAKVHKLEQALNFQKDLRAKSERKRWQDEAKERYPLANVEQITAKSHRAFQKAAAMSHNDNYNHLFPYLEQLEAVKKQLKQEARSEEREIAVQAWGDATVGPTVGEVDEGAFQAGLAEVRKTGNLEKVLRYLRESGKGGQA